MLSVMVENAVWLRRSPGVMLVGLQMGTVSLNSCPGTSAKRADSNANTHCKKIWEFIMLNPLICVGQNAVL